ncbi:MAG TPA: ATP phosphoribosyltransferase regulatory subunit [Methylomirabilota bacterium]|jgi:ATP phosphoribosyltransferase regulatory subunit|nr:ATP phosphoribosyltransferase regulatory subunit [Methylomirabilota bacterium]
MERRVQHTQLPRGAKLYLPDEAAQKRVVEERLREVFRRWGYREIVTPAYEYFDVISQGTDHELQERMFKMVDRESGRLLALRADITPQIARIVATRMRDEPKPLRLAYVTNVFRYDEPHASRYREFYQAGVELLGLPNPEGDAEMIAMTVEGLQALGLGEFQIDVGQAEFFRGILEDLAVDDGVARELRSALGHKDQSSLERLVDELRAPAAVTELLRSLPELYGRGDVLDRAERLVKSARSERALANLAEVYRLLRAYGLADSVLLDLGEVRGFDYYSGVHFEAYVAGLGAPLVGGGRYDQMLGRFGYDCPATGFAFDVGRALLVRDSQGAAVPRPGPDFFIIDFTPEKTRALALSRRLRDLGWAVARDIINRPLDESLVHAREQRARWTLIIGGPAAGGDEDRLRVLDLASGGERVVGIAELLADPARHFPDLKEQRHG